MKQIRINSTTTLEAKAHTRALTRANKSEMTIPAIVKSSGRAPSSLDTRRTRQNSSLESAFHIIAELHQGEKGEIDLSPDEPTVVDKQHRS